ncbi:MAG: hypothetical protein A3F54_00640 [Candidatus Kerfeldbacteria bacterium RIFCSPHIGHO2_12_FULL_48_17]|uniref:Fibronectin type-III domain-containing protein n=1 Tax=Candidatus Kerfeldbacteria bacterium RIFCSPHIGHO2_12_FULL_48_17 TaxID=1798542 RepID=A0A1G2B5I5_9BACT|nr:MAG: hypothetical protein A3F54_00640 [Candidatus Kerfeldbacteria bacterium RIFCSPHIGHO2_12_FULL_48_17]
MTQEQIKIIPRNLIYLIALSLVIAGVILLYFNIDTLLAEHRTLKSETSAKSSEKVVKDFEEQNIYTPGFAELEEYEPNQATTQSGVQPYSNKVPNAPTDIAVKDPGLGTAVIVTWHDPQPATGMLRVYRSSAKSQIGKEIGTVNYGEEFYYDATVKPDETYYYIVRAVLGSKTDEQESKNQDQVSITPKDTTPAPAPTDIEIANSGDGASVTITWKNPQADDFAAIKIYRSEEIGILGKVIESNNVEEKFKDTGLEPGVDYYYTVTALDKKGNESSTKLAFPATGRENPFVAAE